MPEATLPQRPRRWIWFSRLIDNSEPILADNAHVTEALARHKREGIELAIRARTIAMGVIAIMLLFMTPWPEVLYYEVLAGLFILIGLAQRSVARVGTSRAELALLFCDLLLMTITAVVPNPFSSQEFPILFQYQFDIHKYFFIILATATLAYSWRTIVAVGSWTTVLWIIASAVLWYSSVPDETMQETLLALYGGSYLLAEFYDPTRMIWDHRIQEVIVFAMCAFILGISVRRFNNLLLAQAEAERERANLARYFSPNVVDQLSHNDDPLKQVLTQDIAVLFVDIVGFTSYAAHRSPEEVIGTLRRFHGLLEAEVFRHNGTLDKYLGDGLMATFGTPVAGPDDAVNALGCAQSMCTAVDRLNNEREAAGETPLRIGIGVHFGTAVLGDIGGNRLEYAVIGNTVNIASRLEALTRTLSVRVVVSDDVLTAAQACPSGAELNAAEFARREGQEIRGVDTAMTVWTRS